MSDPILPLAVWPSGINEASIPANDNALRVEAMSREVISDAITTQPVSPGDGDVYIIPPGATGTQWATFDADDLTIFRAGTWYAWAPVDGVVVNLSGSLVQWTGSGGWDAVSGGGVGAVTSVNGQTGAVSLAMEDLSNVLPGATTGEVLVFDGSDWAPGSVLSNPMTTAGDLIIGGVSGAPVRLAVGTNGQVLTVVSGSPAWAAASGSLTNWTEALTTSAPNAAVPVASFTANNAATDVDAVFRPKGGGSIAADIADSTSTGGNKRGARSVDWQRTRTLATEVSSGSQSTIGGGNRNTASGTTTVVAGGNRNTASNTSDAVLGGNQNTASGGTSVVCGGTTNTASGTVASILGGEGNTASGDHSICLGGVSSTANGPYSLVFGDTCSARSIHGNRAFNSGPISPGTVDAQREELTLRAISTNATPVNMTSNGSTASATNQMALISGSRAVVRGRVVASQQATGDAKAWEFVALVKRTGIPSTATIIGSVTPSVVAGDAGASAWTITVQADTTNGTLQVVATGEAAKTIKWVCDLDTTYSAG